MWIRCKIERNVASFDVLMKDGASVTFRRYPNVGVHLAHVPTPAHQRVLLGVPEGYEAWTGADPTAGAAPGEATQGAILSGAAQIAAQVAAAASAGTAGGEQPSPVAASAVPASGSITKMSDDELRAFAREQGLSLPPNMRRDNAERRVLEFLELKQAQALEALMAGGDAPPPEGAGSEQS